MDLNSVDIPVADTPEVGVVLPQFEIDSSLLQKASKYVMDSKVYFESQRTDWRENQRIYDRAYRAILEESRAYKGFQDKAAPIIHDNIEAIVARLKNSIAPNNDDLIKIEIEGRPDISKYRTEEIEKQIEKQDISSKIETVARIAAKFGTFFIKCILVNNERPVLTQQLVTTQEQIPIVDDNNEPIIDPNTGQPMSQMQTKQEIKVVPVMDKKYFGPGYDVILDNENIYLDMFIEDVQAQPIIVHRNMVTWEHLMQGVEAGIYFEEQVKKIKDKTTTAQTTVYTTRSQELLGVSNAGQFPSFKNSESRPKEYEMFQAYCDFAIKLKQEDGTYVEKVYACVISVIGNECIQLMPNPYFHQMKPFIKGVYRKIEGEAYGLSAISPVIDLFHEYNDTMNQLNDGKILKINPIIISRGGANTDTQDLDVYPGVRWYEKQPGDIRPFVIDFPLAEGMQYLEILEQRINRGMGITPLLQGAGDSTDLDSTWRGTNKIIQQADKKFQLIAQGIEDASVRQWGELGYKINEQFNPIVNADGSFEQINSEVNIEVCGVEDYFENQENIINYTNFGVQAAQVPGMNIPGLVNTVAEMQGIKIDEQKWGPLYSPPQPPPPPQTPINTSVSMPIDMSKGPTQLFTMAQILKQRGIDLNIDTIAEATKVFVDNVDPETKSQSGVLPPSYDSYSAKDSRSKKEKK